MSRPCIHCHAPVTPPDEVCESCLDLLSDLGEEDEPQPAPQPEQRRPFEPSREDWAAYRELSERGSFRPFDQVRPKQLPSHARNRWGVALKNWKDAGLPDVPKQ